MRSVGVVKLAQRVIRHRERETIKVCRSRSLPDSDSSDNNLVSGCSDHVPVFPDTDAIRMQCPTFYLTDGPNYVTCDVKSTAIGACPCAHDVVFMAVSLSYRSF